MARLESKVLVVEPDYAVRDMVTNMLSIWNYTPIPVATAEQADEQIQSGGLDAILCTFKLGEKNGFDVLNALRRSGEHTAFIMSYDKSMDVPTISRSVREGADDLISRPYNWDELHRTLDRTVKSVHDVRGMYTELDTLRAEATTDKLTGLLNRAGIESAYAKLSGRVTRNNQLYLIEIDLKDFKRVNDEIGHHDGDMVLASTAKKLTEISRHDEVLVGRTGGDEFVIVYLGDNIHAYLNRLYGEAAEFAGSVNNQLREKKADTDICFGLNMGVSKPDQDYNTALGQADNAMYRTKAHVKLGAQGRSAELPLIGFQNPLTIKDLFYTPEHTQFYTKARDLLKTLSR